jgi:hypothetical protein
MCRLIRTSLFNPFVLSFSPAVLGFGLLIMLTCVACGTIPPGEDTGQRIRIENQNHVHMKAYVAFETSPSVRVLLGTIEPNSHEDFRLPSALRGSRPIVVRCERGQSSGLNRGREFYETAYVTLPRYSTLVVTIRDPMMYSDCSVLSME